MDKANDIITNIIKRGAYCTLSTFWRSSANGFCFYVCFSLRKGTRLEEGKPD